MKQFLRIAAFLAVTASAFAGPLPGQKILVNQTSDGLALQGYDPVAYFTDNQPVKGDAKFTAEYDGATYRFASAEHRDVFKSDAAKYAPAFGGYCSYAASIDRLSPISPEVFQIIDGRLMLQHNQKAFEKWNADLKENIAKANANWPGLVQRNGIVGKVLLNLDDQGVAIAGYDPVSYFTDGKPTKGDPKIAVDYSGARYHFFSAAHRETFEKDPAKYVPAYGGYCGYAASIGKVRPINPELWSIVDGRLILQNSKGAVELWRKDVTGNKTKADQYWPRLIEAKAGVKDPVDGLFGRSVLADVK